MAAPTRAVPSRVASSLPSVPITTVATGSSAISTAPTANAEVGFCSVFHGASGCTAPEARRCYVLRPDFEIISPLQESGNVASLVHDVHNGGQVKHRLYARVACPESVCWSAGACRIRDLPNAGGNSMWSEVLSFEVLSALFGARLVRTEMELEYEWPCKITDYSVRLYDHPIGVSVTRAIKFRGMFTDDDALALLSKKLYGVTVSSKYVLESHGWHKQILHVLTPHEYIADVLRCCFDRLDAELRTNTVMIVTVTDNADWIF
eukprot:TRINITY_DN6342_c0_g1_i1.p1 TRINITY_DN6342_c0_g1~~TRINITY_DN6342_c0_g1_i1.p1  ORF type:complete len:263 (-),score=46.19 TRINITY_DN6342_c0_g1_i1:114-902(-)